MGIKSSLIITISSLKNTEEEAVGKKIHELGILQSLGIPIPDGFIITTGFLKEFLRLTGIDEEIKKTDAVYHPALEDSIDKLYYPVQKKIRESPLPQTLAAEFHRFYRKFSGPLKDKPLNVFSSSVGEKSVVFGGISGDANLLLKIKKIWSESFRHPTAIAVQEDIQPEIKGKILTSNPLPDKKLTKQQVSKLMNYCKLVQRYFYFPQEIEYIIKNDKTYITKIHPFTGIVEPKPAKEKKVLARGIVVNPGIVTGPVKVLSPELKNAKIKKGEIVVLSKLDRSIFEEIKKARAAVVGQVLRDSADKALYRRDLGIPTVEGVDNAESIFHNGNVITVNGVNGEIYSGGLV